MSNKIKTNLHNHIADIIYKNSTLTKILKQCRKIQFIFEALPVNLKHQARLKGKIQKNT